MTKAELSQYYYLKRESDNAQRLRKELIRRKLFAKKEEDIKFLEEQAQLLADKSEKCKNQREEIETFVDKIRDSLTRQVLRERYIFGKTWAGVAMAVGGGNSPDSVRKIAERYLAEKERDFPCKYGKCPFVK